MMKWNVTEFESNKDCTPEFILSLPGAFFDSGAGKGKSWLIELLAKYCKDHNEPFKVSAFTNAVANKYAEGETFEENPGTTLHRSFMYGKKLVSVFLIDEVSQVPQNLWKHILGYKRAYPQTKVFLFGDFRQLPAVEMQLHRAVPMENNKTMMDICHQNRITFRKNWRFPEEDGKIFDELYDEPAKLPYYQSRFGGRCDPTQFQRSLASTHFVRKRINHLHMLKVEEHLQGTPAAQEWLPRKVGGYGKCQDMYLHAGLPVIAYKRDSKLGIKQRNATYKVRSFDAETVTLTPWCFFADEEKVSEKDPELTLPKTVLGERFAVAYAVTVHIAQGATIKGMYSIANASSFDRHLLYTALTRCTAIRNVHFCDVDVPAMTEDDYQKLAKRLQRNIGDLYGGMTWLEWVQSIKLPRNWTWWDYGLTFEIDHKVSRKDIPDDIAKLNHHGNLRPLAISENRSKKACSDYTVPVRKESQIVGHWQRCLMWRDKAVRKYATRWVKSARSNLKAADIRMKSALEEMGYRDPCEEIAKSKWKADPIPQEQAHVERKPIDIG
ncbi:hypothetical protein HK097_005932 [Rhizophlyctis rosea]|uniref:Uncharacterized protein n=1 Tax=Rhizophlyctis rosea TaxID=64517 RepID=A0AAD5WZA5_9FUNG|nr:hypothetical protein HK097_005932 [Rhizophlyctis rosea]